MKRDVAAVAALWVLATIAGFIIAQADILPPPKADKAELIDHAFKTLTLMAVPVFMFVVVVVVYSAIRFRRVGPPTGDGASFTGRGPIPVAWLGLTSALTLLVMVYPGLSELPKIVNKDAQPDVIVRVDSFQWSWTVDYPQHGFRVQPPEALVLPVDKVVGFEITARDVVHSVWIPAFRMKIDAVPGLTTYMSLTPTHTGSFEDDPLLRLQCAELCGTSHGQMAMPVAVVDDATFAAWVEEHAPSGSPEPSAPPDAQQLDIASRNPPGTANFVFTTDRLEAEAGRPIVITYANEDVGVLHNLAVNDPGGGQVGMTPLEPGPVVQTLVLPALEPGSYPFLCLAHPLTMTGTLEVK